MPRFVVIEGATSARPARQAIAEFDQPAEVGWHGAPGRLCAGVVRTEDDVGRVVLAALAGADLVVDCRVGREAADLHLSRRTADRRLAAARKALDAASTPEAVVKATRLGLLGPGRRPG